MSEKREAVWRAIAEWASAEEFTGALIYSLDQAIDDEIADERRQVYNDVLAHSEPLVTIRGVVHRIDANWLEAKAREEGQMQQGEGSQKEAE